MSDARTRECAEARLREASQWLVVHESGDSLEPEGWEDWNQWTADPGNCAEFDAIARLREDIGSLRRPSLPTRLELQLDSSDARCPESTDGPRAAHRPRDIALCSRRPLSIGLAALAAALAACSVAVLMTRPPAGERDRMDPGQVYTTGAGEQREVRLEDGSTVTLAGNTALVTRLADHERSVVLYRGEALFEVKRDPSRPFTVFAAGGKITALGTAFDVRRYSQRVQVAVTEGAVEVAPRETPVDSESPEEALARESTRWIPLRVAHGQEMTYDTQGEASAPKPSNTQLATAWTLGALIYRGSPLHEVIEDVQRYSAREIVLDPAIGNLNYTGTVLQGSVKQWILRLPDIFSVEVVSSGDDRILIRSRVPRATGSANALPKQ